MPFGQGKGRDLVGLVVELKTLHEKPKHPLKTILEVLDDGPLLTAEVFNLCQWASDYYHFPLGETLATALPKKLRQGTEATLDTEIAWVATVQSKGLAPDALKRAPKQKHLLDQLKSLGPLTDEQIKALALHRSSLKALQQKGLVAEQAIAQQHEPPSSNPAPHPLTDEQAAALAKIPLDRFQVTVIEGITGSGKTEIYLQAIAEVISRGRQALVLIPEIGLSPQTLARFHQRFNANIVVLHSGLNDSERCQHWLKAREGLADIVIGTRSAIFTPMPKLGLIVIDEEHDLSFKQQDGLRYSARDLAAVRARSANIPVLLGSATPSLETLHNISQGRFALCQLHSRPGAAEQPQVQLFDICKQNLREGFSEQALTNLKNTLNSGQQALVFINRRGFAPSVMCHDCGWIARCQHCDSNLTVHSKPAHLRCHHCDYQRPRPRECPQCFSHKLLYQGTGTEKAEAFLQQELGDYRVIRIDRDSTQRKNAFERLLEPVNAGEPAVLVGTQMLVKGHHFPNVTLVVVIDADGGLFGSDFRASERTGQMLLQVAGRAGRGEQPGRVLIQTHNPDHPLFTALFSQSYRAFTDLLMSERGAAHMPPFTFMAIARAESSYAEEAEALLEHTRSQLQQLMPSNPQHQYLGPMPAMLERVNNRYRYTLQIKSHQRRDLHQALAIAINFLAQQPSNNRLRWSMDVDPQETP